MMGDQDRTGSQSSRSGGDSIAGDTDRSRSQFLQDFLAVHRQPCPGCGYELHALRGSNCPECGTELKLAVNLVNPDGRLFALGLSGLACGLGVGAFTLTLMLYLTMLYGPAPFFWPYGLAAGMTFASAILLVIWFSQRARFRRLSNGARLLLALSTWVVPVIFGTTVVFVFEGL